MKYFKTLIFISFTFQLLGCNSLDNKCTREQAIHFLNVLDSVHNMIADPPDNLARYLQNFTKSISQEEYDFRSSQIDSLENFYQIYIITVDSAINVVSSLNGCKDFDSLKQCYLNLYREEKKLWPTVIPIFIKVFRKGWLSASKQEKTKIKSTSLIIRNTVPLINKLGAKGAEYYIAFHKKYNLKFIDR